MGHAGSPYPRPSTRTPDSGHTPSSRPGRCRLKNCPGDQAAHHVEGDEGNVRTVTILSVRKDWRNARLTNLSGDRVRQAGAPLTVSLVLGISADDIPG